MTSSDVQATLTINGGRQGGAEAWTQTVTLRLDPGGFRDATGVGREGDATGAADVNALGRQLTAQFDSQSLAQIFDQLDRLRQALAP